MKRSDKKQLIELALKWRAGVHFLKRCVKRKNDIKEVDRLNKEIVSLKCNLKYVLEILSKEKESVKNC